MLVATLTITGSFIKVPSQQNLVIFYEVENEFFSFFYERETVVVAYCDTCKVAICSRD